MKIFKFSFHYSTCLFPFRTPQLTTTILTKRVLELFYNRWYLLIPMITGGKLTFFVLFCRVCWRIKFHLSVAYMLLKEFWEFFDLFVSLIIKSEIILFISSHQKELWDQTFLLVMILQIDLISISSFFVLLNFISTKFKFCFGNFYFIKYFYYLIINT